MARMLNLAVWALAAASASAAWNAPRSLKARQLQDDGVNVKPYLVRLSDSALQYAQAILLPQLEQMTENGQLPKFVAEHYKSLSGAGFSGVGLNLSPEALQFISSIPIVEAIQPDILLRGNQAATPSAAPPPAFKQEDVEWHLDRIDSRERKNDDTFYWTQDGSGVDIYIMDSGINTAHQDFTGRLQPGANFVPDQSAGNVEDCNGHGTHVSALAGGTTYGVAKKATIVPVRIYGCDNSGPLSQALEGINWVIARIATSGRRSVVNMSFGGDRNFILDDAVDKLVSVGAVVVAAAGNEATDACSTSPAGAPSAITVGASDSSDNYASFSNYGSCVDIIAPGRNIKSAWIGGATATRTISGTSMASPIVAGAAAQFLQARPGASVRDVRDGLVCSGTTDVLSSIPTSSTPDVLLYTPPGGFAVSEPCVTSDASVFVLSTMTAAVIVLASLMNLF